MTSKKPSFNSLKKAELLDSVPYILEEIRMKGKTPIIHVAIANRSNRNLMAAVQREHPKLVKKMAIDRANSKEPNLQDLEQNREIDKKLYGYHVIKDWENVYNDDGEEVKFTPAVCVEFLSNLPDYIFDRIRVFCVNPDNFRDYTVSDLLETAKNSD